MFGKRDMSIDAQWRRRNIKAWVITLLVTAILIGGAVLFTKTIDDRQREKCRDSGGTPVTVRHWDPGGNTGKPRWQTSVECQGA